VAPAEALEAYRGRDVVVLGLPRGGVPVAYQVASALDALLDVIVVRKLGVPFRPEVAMGATGEDGIRVLDRSMVARAEVTESELAAVERREQEVFASRLRHYRRGRDRVDLRARTAIVVDDGVATGSTARAACRITHLLGAAEVVLAVPVGPTGTLRDMREADTVVAVEEPPDLRAVGLHSDDFSPTSDDEVGLQGHLHLPDPCPAVVVFAHGSGSGRHSPRNRRVADVLYEAGIGTLLLDLLTPAEEHDRRYVFDIDLLARRLVAAADRPSPVSAVVSRAAARISPWPGWPR
jgi:putative phosphoribosyl transferase